MSGKVNSCLFTATMLAVFLSLSGCGGSDGTDGKDGKDGDPAGIDPLAEANSVKPESCLICHSDDGSIALSGAGHQADYALFYQDQVLRVINLQYSNDGTNDIVTFDMTKKDDLGVEQDFDCRNATTNPEPDVTDALNIYFTQYTDPGFEITEDVGGPGFAYNWVSLKGDLTYDGSGGCTSTKAQSPLGNLNDGTRDGVIAVFGRDETLFEDPLKHISSAKYPFATILKLPTASPANVDYVSNANAEGCENCHTRPFLKHTYIYGEVNDGSNNDGNDFYVCKSCHIDNGVGGVEAWQILKDDPVRHAAIVAGSPLTANEKTKYAYKTRLMNDVHMSHSMEFGYPQSIKNCATCHADKLDTTLTAANFTAETCISCHSVDGLATIMTKPTGTGIHDTFFDNVAMVPPATVADAVRLKTMITCNTCHKPLADMGVAPEFKAMHTGYDPEIYANALGTKYSEAFVVSVDVATFDSTTNILTIEFHADEPVNIAGLAVTDIAPTVMIGLYGYDSKHYIIPPHDRDADRNRLLEYEVGATHPRFTTVSATGGAWVVTADLSMWAGQIADGTIKRAEIGVMPVLDDAAGEEVAMNAPSRTFDLTLLPSGAFLGPGDAGYFDLVNVTGGCNTCHDALATTFHSGKRGGNIKICKMCHVPSAAGSHLEMQSRSIDSYVHAIHSFQAFDIGDIDFSDPVEAAEHDHKIKSEFPRFGIKNCESCHNPGTYGVPDQSKSLPSLNSGSDVLAGGRNIGTVPSYVMGPAARACGACHRAQMINADDAGKLAAFNGHVEAFGYMVENNDGVWDTVVEKIMSLF